MEGKGHVPGEEIAELVPRDKLCESRWEGGRAPGVEDAVSPEAQRPERTMLSQGKCQYSGSIWLSKPAAHPLTYSQWKKFPPFEH